MEFSHNPYYNPEKCGLDIFETVDTGGSYEFDMLVIWRKLDDNTLWYATDAGCSCPTPFDPGRHDLEQITKETFFGFDNALKNHSGIDASEYSQISMSVRQYLKIKKNMKAPK